MRSLKAVGLGTAVALSALIVCASGADAADKPSTRSETKFSLVGKATGQTVVDVAQDGHVGPGDLVDHVAQALGDRTAVGDENQAHQSRLLSTIDDASQTVWDDPPTRLVKMPARTHQQVR